MTLVKDGAKARGCWRAKWPEISNAWFIFDSWFKRRYLNINTSTRRTARGPSRHGGGAVQEGCSLHGSSGRRDDDDDAAAAAIAHEEEKKERRTSGRRKRGRRAERRRWPGSCWEVNRRTPPSTSTKTSCPSRSRTSVLEHRKTVQVTLEARPRSSAWKNRKWPPDTMVNHDFDKYCKHFLKMFPKIQKLAISYKFICLFFVY